MKHVFITEVASRIVLSSFRAAANQLIAIGFVFISSMQWLVVGVWRRTSFSYFNPISKSYFLSIFKFL